MTHSNERISGTPEGKNGLEHVLDTIKEKGLPSVDEMRALVEERRFKEFVDDTQRKISEYRILFDRFKTGETLTDDEMKRMGALSDELENLRRRAGSAAE